MKKIGEGWQYTVYDAGNGRVYKKRRSWISSYIYILKTTFPWRGEETFKKIPGYIQGLDEFLRYSATLLKERNVSNADIGNIEWKDNFNYFQDKVESLRHVLAKASSDKRERIIDAFVSFTQHLLNTYGLIDKGFNICNNFGMDTAGRIILIDVGELHGSENKILKQIENRAWTKKYVLCYLPDEESRQYFIKQMDTAFLRR